jgi:hemerythrin-like domain-containing protein
VPTRKRRANGNHGRTSSEDVIQLLKKDHERVRKLLSELEEASNRAVSRRESLVEQIADEVRIHSTVEEEIFYPAFFEAASSHEDSKLFYEAAEEHGVVASYLIEIEQASKEGDEFSAKAKVLKDLIEHHADEEEEELMPRARKLLSQDQLRELGSRTAERKKELKSAAGATRRA